MSTGHFFGVRYHRHMLKDTTRTEGYRRAIAALVRPGDVVVDVGAGTGVMSIFAARAGASRVYAIESTPIARLARRIIADSGLSEVIEVIEGDAGAVSLPEPADLLVTECMGNFVYSDAMLGVLARCRGMLKPDARICPSNITTWLAPSFLAPIFGEFSWWESPHYDIDFSAALQSAVNDTYNIQCPSPQLLSAPPVSFGEIRPTMPPPVADGARQWTFSSAGPVDCVLGWFSAALSAEHTLDTGPGSYTHWGQQLFPIPTIQVEPGGTLHFHLKVTTGHLDLPTYSWSGRYLHPDGSEGVRFSRGQDRRFDF
jgi:SAM-dependent methyltransferase